MTYPTKMAALLGPECSYYLSSLESTEETPLTSGFLCIFLSSPVVVADSVLFECEDSFLTHTKFTDVS